MSKFRALFKNEIIKMFHKKFLYVTFAIALLLFLAIGMLVNAFRDNLEYEDYYGVTTKDVYEYIDQLSYGKNEKIPELQSKLTAIVDGYKEEYGEKVDYSLLLNSIADLAQDFLAACEDGETLTKDEYDYLINQIAITEYRLSECKEEYLIENDGDRLNGEVSQIMIYIAFYITLMLMMILGGSSVSNEMSSGTIKSLIIAPVKRSKIFFAKITSVITVGVLMYIAEYIFICIYCGILFGVDNSFFVFSNGTQVFSMSVYLKNFLYVLISCLPLTAYASFAFMMSCVTRNTASAVGASMGIFYAGNIVISILEMFINSIYIKITPLFHFNALSSVGFEGDDIFNKLFKYTQSSSYSFFRSSTDFGFWFSAIYVVIFAFLMLWIAYDSFTRRDI